VSKFYQAKVQAADWVFETIVELPDDLPLKPRARFEDIAQACAGKAILKRWRELYPDGRHLNLQFFVQVLPDNSGEPTSGRGPYRFDYGIKAWIVDAPFSWGALSLRPKY
jgi:hypothetical protein